MILDPENIPGKRTGQSDPYSHYKAAHHRERLDLLRRGEMINPVYAEIDLTNACNLDCSFCSYRVGNYSLDQIREFNPADRLETKRVFELLEEMKKAGVKAIEWSGGGEPNMHRDWKEIVQRAKEMDYEQALVTNGTLLGEDGSRAIRDFEWTRFSVDAAKERTYFKIKKRPFLEATLKNIERLVRIKTPRNIVGFSFVVCRENYSEIHEAAKIAKNIGANNVRFSLAYTPEGREMFKGIWDETVEQIGKAKQEQTKDFTVFAFPNRINELSQRTKCDGCYFDEFVVTIGANGAVYPCCLLKYDPEFNLGNLNEQSFKEIWFGNKRKEFVKRVRRAGCGHSCWMTDKNDFVGYLLAESPRHVNFF